MPAPPASRCFPSPRRRRMQLYAGGGCLAASAAARNGGRGRRSAARRRALAARRQQPQRCAPRAAACAARSLGWLKEGLRAMQALRGAHALAARDFAAAACSPDTPTQPPPSPRPQAPPPSALPVVLWHGMGDSCCAAGSMGAVKEMIEEELGVFVYSVATGDGEYKDIWASFMGNVNSQVGLHTIVCVCNMC